MDKLIRADLDRATGMIILPHISPKSRTQILK